MKVLIFSTFHLPPHFLGLNMEFVQRSVEKGDEVYFVNCLGTFQTCGFNTYSYSYMCDICNFRTKNGHNLLPDNLNKLSLQSLIKEGDIQTARDFVRRHEEIGKDLKFEDFEVGEAVFSSFISKTREQDLDGRLEILRTLTINSIQIYLSLKRFVSQESFDQLFLFNGRWDYYRAALAASRSCGLKIEIFENFRSGGFFETYGDSLPHDILTNKALIDKNWYKSRHNQKEKEAISREFFTKRRQGQAVFSKSFTGNQKKGLLPPELDSNKKTYILFNSSDDEFAAVGEGFKNPFFIDQKDGILYLIEFFSNHPNLQLVIRMHPNLVGLKRGYLDPIYESKNKYNNIIIIEPQDPVDTYELMSFGYVIISFGSTAGLEAAYWNKPVVLLGKCFYYYSDVAYVPRSRTEISELLLSDLKAKGKVEAMKFAYYYQEGGKKGRFYYYKNLNKVFYNNQPLHHLPYWFKIKYKLKKWLVVFFHDNLKYL
ncbi:MAG: hypothetical protein AAF149_00520 [Bacteroidota bacterium]